MEMTPGYVRKEAAKTQHTASGNIERQGEREGMGRNYFSRTRGRWSAKRKTSDRTGVRGRANKGRPSLNNLLLEGSYSDRNE